MSKTIIVFDFETDDTDPETTNPIQIGAVAIDSIRLKVIPDSEFYAWCRPDTIDDPNYIQQHKQTLDWHAKNYGWSIEKLMDKIKEQPSEKQVFENFVEYLKKYHTKASGQSKFTAPILAGFNSFNFDFPILDRLCKKYGRTDKNGKQDIYFTRDSIDIMKIVTLWLAPLNELKSFSMDNLRDYFGISSIGAHDASKDIKDEANILIKFLGLHKRLSTQIAFKNAFAPKEELEYVG